MMNSSYSGSVETSFSPVICLYTQLVSSASVQLPAKATFRFRREMDMLGISMPLISGVLTLLVGLNVPMCGCCCGSARSPKAHCGARVVVGLFGVVHLFLHAGYLVAPPLMIIASVLPPSVANKGVEASAPKGKTATVPNVDSTPSTGNVA